MWQHSSALPVSSTRPLIRPHLPENGLHLSELNQMGIVSDSSGTCSFFPSRHLQLLTPHMDGMPLASAFTTHIRLLASALVLCLNLRRSIAMFADCGQDFQEMLSSSLPVAAALPCAVRSKSSQAKATLCRGVADLTLAAAQALAGAFVRICSRDEVVVQEGDFGEEMFVSDSVAHFVISERLKPKIRFWF